MNPIEVKWETSKKLVMLRRVRLLYNVTRNTFANPALISQLEIFAIDFNAIFDKFDLDADIIYRKKRFSDFLFFL